MSEEKEDDYHPVSVKDTDPPHTLGGCSELKSVCPKSNTLDGLKNFKCEALV